MAMIKCPECGKEISDKSESCIHCGYPIKFNHPAQGKVIIQTEKVFLGIGGCFLLHDENKKLLTKIKPGDTYEIKIDSDRTLYIKTPALLCKFQALDAYAGQINRFSVSIALVNDFCTVKRI